MKESHAIHGQTHAEIRDHHRLRKVERHLRSGHVRDDTVRDRRHTSNHSGARDQAPRDPREHPRHELCHVGQIARPDRLGHRLRFARGLVDQFEAPQRVRFVGMQAREHARNLVARRPGLVFRPNGDRREGRQRFLGKLVMMGEVAAQRSTTDGQDDVVHSRPRRRLPNLLHVGEREGPGIEDTMGRDPAIESCAGNVPGRILVFVRPALVDQRLDHRRCRVRQHPRETERLTDVVHGAAEREFDERRLRLRNPIVFGRRRHGIRVEVVDRRRDLRARNAIDGGMMDLRLDREAALRQAFDAVEALDDVHLPEWLVVVERSRMQARRLNAELSPVPRLRQGDMPDVEFEVEIRVLDPVGMIEPVGELHDLLAIAGGQMQPALDVREDALEGDALARGRRLVVDR